MIAPWDYLIVTASNDRQAQGYQALLDVRQELGMLANIEHVMVVADPGGRRVGSGGSTLCCLMEVLKQELGEESHQSRPNQWLEALQDLRILIIHAGGDSKRLPGYGPCGKIFVPVPGETDRCLPLTLFDRQLPTYLALPSPPGGMGQTVITSGDVMLWFDPTQVHFDQPGMTGLGCYAPPEQAARHGVYCGVQGQVVKRFLQKPTPETQQTLGAVDPFGQAILDIGVMSFDAPTAVRFLEIFGAGTDRETGLTLTGEMGRAVMEQGLDFYREICCALGTEASSSYVIEHAHASGSTWDAGLLGRLFQGLHDIAFHLDLLRQCHFIDFGSTNHIIGSGTALTQLDRGAPQLNSCLSINNEVTDDARLAGTRAWVEGCRMSAPVDLAGENVLLGLDIHDPLTLSRGACVDVLPGQNRESQAIWFIRCYGIDDTIKEPLGVQATFCNRPLVDWMEAVGVASEDLWDAKIDAAGRSLWDAKLFPAVTGEPTYREWLWMFDPSTATAEQKKQWRQADRYSLTNMAWLADHDRFFQRRQQIRSQQIKQGLLPLFRRASRFSALELAYLLKNSDDVAAWIGAVLSQAKWYHDNGAGLDQFIVPRILHTLGAAVSGLAEARVLEWDTVCTRITEQLAESEHQWLKAQGLGLKQMARPWIDQTATIAFKSLNQIIITGTGRHDELPGNALRSDEIVWGRAPARFDSAGGWTDTPPHSLEFGGCVVNTAIDLNGQPPIQAYVRVIFEPIITIGSIDLGTRIHIRQLDELLDYGQPDSQYGLAKAALALTGFSPAVVNWPSDVSLKQMLEQFGGGIELTTLAAIPKGSGLGTSSIMGAVILAVLQRALGKTLGQRELFNKVLQLEQALTTGGGWQDQIGGCVGGTKIIHADRGIVPDARIHYLPSDVFDPTKNGATTLLYYTGLTRLAKGILGQVVGRYLNRNRASMSVLERIGAQASIIADAISAKDMHGFGQLIHGSWELNKQLDPHSSNEQVEAILSRVSGHLWGSKLLGAGGGGFLFMVCKSPADAGRVREMLENDPPNDRARFFDYSINQDGLVVTVC
jgi:fucokinase